MKKRFLMIFLLLTGCGEAGTVNSEVPITYENLAEGNLKIKAVQGYAGVNPIVEGSVVVREFGSNDVLASASTDDKGLFHIFIPINPEVEFFALSVEEGRYVEPVGKYETAITDRGLRTILQPDEIKYPIYITPFTDMIASLYLYFVENSLKVNDPLKYARALMADYFEVDFISTSPSANIGRPSLNEGASERYQFLIDGLSQMARNRGLPSSFALTKALAESLEANANFSGYAKGGGRIYVDDYTINYDSMRVDFTKALEGLLYRQPVRSKALEDYIDRLRNKPSILLGSTRYAK